MGPAEKQYDTALATTTASSTNARAAKKSPPPPSEETTETKSSSMLSAVGNFLFGDHSRDNDHRHNHRRHHNKHHRHANGGGSFHNHASLERKANRLSALNFDNRVYTLMSVQRQDLLKVLAYNYLASSSSSSSSSSSLATTTSPTSSSTLSWSSSSSDRTSIQRLERQLINYENIERVELLKLAVWKSQCLLQFPSGKYRSYLDMDEWKEVGWMTQKTQVFGTSTKLVEVVAAGVLPFLSGPMSTSNTVPTNTVASHAYRGGGTRSAQSRSRSQSRTLGNGDSSKGAASATFASSSATKSDVSRSVQAKSSAGNKRKRGLDDGDGEDHDDHNDHNDHHGRNDGGEGRHATTHQTHHNHND